MAAAPWWVLVHTSYGTAPQYAYFQGTQAEAEARAHSVIEVSSQRNLYGPYSTKADAQAAVKKGLTAPTPGGGGVLPPPPGIDTPPSGGASNPASGLAAIGDFITTLETAATWERVAKVVLGAALILVGMAKLTGATGAIKSAAGKVPVIV